ncbi:MAG: tRNA uridine-5-carboxymethylaminomethyl(34) synthesis GTPase MnmE [Clostridia bacterium]|nr:tRNA uridine-5-carboxymethylaminomethyl(34) synthesis GTPase MnmE [Clostridia bacterium]
MKLDRVKDTVAAQATPVGEGGIAIVRMTGAQSERILSRVFSPKNGRPVENRRLTFGHILDGQEHIDEAMAVLMRAPHSYTREDVVEIHCHGSQALVGRILRLLLREGARMAEPGEFTYRAFINGRIDLAQAEGVMRMIRSDSERALRSAVRQLEGGVSAYVREARERIIALLASISAALDFPDEVDETLAAREVMEACRAMESRLRASCDPRVGRMEEEGLRVVLAGQPNAGKSSLLNALVGGERAIVTDVPGTTRDTLTEAIQLEGLRVVLTDTAGLRETSDAVERIGVERARKALSEADVRVWVLDHSSALDERSEDVLCGTVPHLVVLSKGDLPSRVEEQEIGLRFPGIPVVTVSSLTGEGMDELRRALVAFAPESDAESAVLSQARHVEAALRACDALSDAAGAIREGMPMDVAAIDLSAALDILGEITGETLNESVIDQVFARFCVGK